MNLWMSLSLLIQHSSSKSLICKVLWRLKKDRKRGLLQSFKQALTSALEGSPSFLLVLAFQIGCRETPKQLGQMASAPLEACSVLWQRGDNMAVWLDFALCRERSHFTEEETEAHRKKKCLQVRKTGSARMKLDTKSLNTCSKSFLKVQCLPNCNTSEPAVGPSLKLGMTRTYLREFSDSIPLRLLQISLLLKSTPGHCW